MKNVILTPNPYRDRNFQTVRGALQILKDAEIRAVLCLPFDVDKNYELPKDLHFSRLERERAGDYAPALCLFSLWVDRPL